MKSSPLVLLGAAIAIAIPAIVLFVVLRALGLAPWRAGVVLALLALALAVWAVTGRRRREDDDKT